MASQLYDKARNRFARGELSWKASGGSTIRAFLIDAATYTPDLAAHEFLSDVPSGARKGASGGNTRADAPQLTLLDPTAGICDAQDVTFATVPAGDPLEYILLFADVGGADSSSPLVALIDDATGLPVTPDGNDVIVAWDDGANKIFKL